ncbi:MAG: DUF547 domain-containing protein [Candidatus Omnitrophica bacterium]|nr:DUF547 domain-containing protein [Candidatus Omnitrophota bacterium]
MRTITNSRYVSLLMGVMIAFSTMAAAQQQPKEKYQNAVDYTPYAKVLHEFVNAQGLVDYEGLQKNRREFDRFMDIIEHFDVGTLDETQAKAFWINAYNAVTLKVVLDAYPVRGIRWINFGLVWEWKRDVAGQKLSLGHIEHKILRPMGDPRIHFAINCASIGCPKLPNEPFYPQSLDAQLDHETRRFINDPQKVYLDRKANILYFSAIFQWFKKDFLISHSGITDYIRGYLNEADQDFINNHKIKTKVLDYDWGLNKQ